jgi:hypothetical protein
MSTHETPMSWEKPPQTETHTFITPETPLGGATYPFLEKTGQLWRIVNQSIETPFSSSQPTLRWVNGNKLIDLFVERMDTKQFLAATGLELHMDRGGFVLSKRLSRLMRPYFVTGHFPENDISVTYRDDLDRQGSKVWDGAGLISRSLLERLTLPTKLSPSKRDYLQRQLRHCNRVEFTLMSAAGQDKGHAIVADYLPTDFVLPRDTKPEVRLIDGTRFIGIDFIHAHQDMQLDIQSMINLYPFFGVEQLGHWLEDEGTLFAQAVTSGEVSEVMGRLDHTPDEEYSAWPLQEYLASGGHPLWFGDIVRQLMNQHLARLNHTTLSKLRLPIPGGRFYAMPIGVGQAGGIAHDIPRGQVRIDRHYATVWVNDEDWCQLEGSSTGIAGLLGGADNDDALWVHGFTDYDGEAKVLCWRSPNQAGEYVVLQPTLGSYPLDWTTTRGVAQYPPADSRMLPPRKDMLNVTYQHLIHTAPQGEIGTGKPYSIEAMRETQARAIANAGTLGTYCNMLMLSQALYGRLPLHPPAELEAVIDASVKTGADLSRVRQWCYEAAQRLRERAVPVPELLVSRLPGARTAPDIARTTDHWLDQLTTMIHTHCAAFERTRDTLVERALPPPALFEHVFTSPEFDYIEAGRGLHTTHHTTLRLLLRETTRLSASDYAQARAATEAYLERFPTALQPIMLRTALVSGYMSEQPSDTVLWFHGSTTEQGRTPGIAHRTIAALRDIGLLHETGKQSEMPLTAQARSYQRAIGINGVWFHWVQRWQEQRGQPADTLMRGVPRKTAVWAKTQIAQFAQTRYRGLTLHIQTEGSRKVAYLPDRQHLFGYLSQDSAARVPEGEITLAFSLSHDGNLCSLWYRPDEALSGR